MLLGDLHGTTNHTRMDVLGAQRLVASALRITHVCAAEMPTFKAWQSSTAVAAGGCFSCYAGSQLT
jgi:hypothetical protein